MTTEKLVTFTEAQRRSARAAYADPQGDEVAEAQANELVRAQIQQLTYALEVALAHPDDPDCARLLALLKQL